MPGLTSDASVDLSTLSSCWPPSRIVREPLALLDALFDLQPTSSHTSNNNWGLSSFVQHSFSLPSQLPSPTPTSLSSIPLLPPLSSSLPPPPTSSLVRFRGLVHDTHSSDYYLGVYRTGPAPSAPRTGKYRDVVRVDEGQEVDEASMKTFERMNVTLVEVPGENAWTKEALDGPLHPPAHPAVSSLTPRQGRKRGMEDRAEDGDIGDTSMEEDEEEVGNEAAKRSRAEKGETDVAPLRLAPHRGVVVTVSANSTHREAGSTAAHSSSLSDLVLCSLSTVCSCTTLT